MAPSLTGEASVAFVPPRLQPSRTGSGHGVEAVASRGEVARPYPSASPSAIPSFPLSLPFSHSPVSATVIIRVLAPPDVDLARDLLAVFGRAFEDEARYTSRQPDDAYLSRLLGGEGFIAIVAQVDGRVVGGLAGYVLPKLEQPRSECYLYDLAVEAGYRRRGLAKALVERLRAEAGARGIEVIFVQADRGDDPAIALYASYGPQEDVLHFDLPVDRGPDPG